MVRNVIKNLARALEIRTIIGNEAASKNPEAAFSTIPDALNFYYTGEGFFLRVFV